MEKYVCIVDGSKITIQEAFYIEDGCYIEIIGNTITLFEIPYGGGKENKIGQYETLKVALDKIKTLN